MAAQAAVAKPSANVGIIYMLCLRRLSIHSSIGDVMRENMRFQMLIKFIYSSRQKWCPESEAGLF
jgi:hypothetical protein